MERLLNAGERFYRIEQKEPDLRAITDAWNRLFGRPVETVTVSADVRQTSRVVIEVHPTRCTHCGQAFTAHDAPSLPPERRSLPS